MKQQFMTVRGANNAAGEFDWPGAVVDAAIIAGVTFFSTLGAGTVTGVPTTMALMGASIAAATQFCITLAIKRGLREPEP